MFSVTLVPSVNDLFRKRRLNDDADDEPSQPRVKRESMDAHPDNDQVPAGEAPLEKHSGRGSAQHLGKWLFSLFQVLDLVRFEYIR